jgi:hypothetical protein
MSLTNSKLSVEAFVPDSNVTYFVTLQSANTGKSAVDYVSPLLTYNTGLGQFFVNNRVVPTSNVASTGSVATSPTPPPFPSVGDLWYDTTTDIQFEYIFDGTNYQWVDITSTAISTGKVPDASTIFTYTPLTANANTISTITAVNGDSVTFSTYNSAANGYPLPYTFFVDSGTLPTGLSLNSSTGVVSGKLNLVISLGSFLTSTVTFAVKDATGYVAGNKVTVTFTTWSTTYVVSYLMVGGGGGVMPYGSNAATGGGGGGGVLYGCATLTRRNTYPVVVGAGGSDTQASSFIAAPNSTFFGLTAYGGGAGTYYHSPGGSGGGNGSPNPAPSQPSTCRSQGFGWPGAAGNTQQGFPGGNSVGVGAPTAGGGGGGGGANSAGVNATPGTAGAGGSGYLWPFTGQTYGGGGGGGAWGTTAVGAGGPGGGASGQKGPGTLTAPAIYGVNGLGGGAGGIGSTAGPAPIGAGAWGGSGTIILAIPGSNYAWGGSSFPGATVACAPPALPGGKLVQYVATSSPGPTNPASFTITA